MKFTGAIEVVLLFQCILLVVVSSDDDANMKPSASIPLDSVPSASKRTIKEAAEAVSVSLSTATHLTALHDDNYDAFVRDNTRISVVLYYAPWSRRSLQFVSDYSDAADSYVAHVNVSFAIVNCPNHKLLCKHAKVNSFPHLRVIVRGNIDTPVVYTPHHENKKEIVDFVEVIRVKDKRRAKREKRLADLEKAKPAEVFHPTPGVAFELDPENFDNYTQSTQILAFVLFYAPWCESCKPMHTILNEVAFYFILDTKVHIGKIDCDRYQQLCISKNIEGYPTMVTYAKPNLAKGGTVFMGERESTDIMNHLDMQNIYKHSEELVEIKKLYDQYSIMSEEDRPEDPTEMGGIFASFGAMGKPMKAGEEDPNKPRKLGVNPRQLLRPEDL